MDSTCSTPDCDRPRHSRGLCEMHYWRHLRDLKKSGTYLPRPPHLLSDIDEVKRMATCSRCGPWIRILRKPDSVKSDVRWKCLRVKVKRLPAWTSQDLRLWASHRIRLDDYNLLLDRQGGVCAICGDAPQEGKLFSVDHDHACCPVGGRSCGKCIRGLLCTRCNTGIGHLKDDPAVLMRALAYLSATRPAPPLAPEFFWTSVEPLAPPVAHHPAQTWRESRVPRGSTPPLRRKSSAPDRTISSGPVKDRVIDGTVVR